MKLFTNQIANTFSSVKQFVTYIGGNRAYATVEQLNQIITKLVPSYKIGTYKNNITAKEASLNAPILSSREKFVYSSAFAPSAFTALVPGFKINFADIGNQSELFSIDRVEVVIGYEGANNWDGGDLEIWLGNTLIATVPAAKMTNTSGVTNYSKSLLVPVTGIIELATGAYANPMVGPGVVFTNPNTIFNVRLSAPTTLFNGFVGVNVTAAKENSDCGTWCDPTCDFNDPADHIYCSIIAGGKCSWCPGSGGSFDATSTSPI